MKQIFKVTTIVLTIIVSQGYICSQTLYNGVGHIPLAYQETWTHAGFLSDAPAITPKAVFVVTNMSGTTMDQKVSAAINYARSYVSGTNGLAFVYFPEGTFYLNNKIVLNQNDRNIVFQGAGSDQTTLVFQNLTNDHCFYIAGTYGSWSDLDQNFDKGESVLHAPAGGLNAISAGNWVHFVQYNFDYNTHNPGFLPAIVGQITRLEAKGTDATGEWGEIKDVANMNYEDSGNTNYSLKIRKINPVQNIGIEDLKIMRSPFQKASESVYVYNIFFYCAVNCWVKGVDSYKPSRNHLCAEFSSHTIISGCYFHEAMDYCESGWGYGVVLSNSSTNCLIENNIFRYLRHAMVASAGSNCNVWTMNYSREQHYTTPGWPTYRDLDLHAKYPFGHLFEHNVIEMIGADNYHGDNGPYNAFVRNHSYDGNISLDMVDKAMEDWSSLGNIYDDSPLNSVYQQYVDPPICDIFGFFNNYTAGYSHNVCHTHFNDSDAELYDVSYYYSSRPNFLPLSYTWPAIGPKISSTQLTQSIPAKDRYNESKKTYLPNPTPKPLTLSGTLPYSQKWSGAITLMGNVTVPSGITLTIQTGTTVNVPAGKKITIIGKLYADGSAFAPVSDTWLGIEFINAPDNYSHIQNCTITNANTGVYMYGTDVTLSNNYIHNNTTGVLFYSNASGNMSNCHLTDNSDFGVKCQYSSHPILFSYNVITYNGYSYGDAGVYGDETSIFDLGQYYDQGFNSIYGNDLYDVQSSYSGTIYARNNWWGEPDPPQPNVTDPPVDWSNPLSTDPNPMLGKQESQQSAQSRNAIQSESARDTVGITELDRALGIYQKGDYKTSALEFEIIVYKYPDHLSGRIALTFLHRCNKNMKDEDANSALLNDVSNQYVDIEIDAVAKNLLVSDLIEQGDYQGAIDQCQAVTRSFSETDYNKYALYDLGNIHWYFLNDQKNAETYFRQLIAQYPDDHLAISALATLDEWTPDEPKPEQQPLAGHPETEKYSLDQNYPNPFNPETTVRYHLAEASRVTIKIYNLLGEEVITLVDQIQLQGNHAIQWNGQDRFGNMVSNGVYWMRMSAGKFLGQRKLIVLR